MLTGTDRFLPVLPTDTARVLASTIDLIAEESFADTVSVLPAVSEVPPVIVASTSVATLFRAIIAPTLTVSEPPAGVTLIEVPAFTMRASMMELPVAVTETLPSASIVVSSVQAFVVAGDFVPSVLPMMASTVLNRKFWASQPMVLKARVTPTPTPFELMLELIVDRMLESLLASTITAPSAVVVRTLSVA